MAATELAQFRQRPIRAQLDAVLAAAGKNLTYYRAPEVPEFAGAELAAEWRGRIGLLGGAVHALAELYAGYDATLAGFAMAQRSPWPDDELAPLSHLGAVWFLLVNHCGLFRERAKEFANAYNRAVAATAPDRERIDVAAELKRIDRELGSLIRARASSLAAWYVEQAELDAFDAGEIVDATERVDSPLGPVEVPYDDARRRVADETARAIGVMEDFLLAMFAGCGGPLIEAIADFDKVVAAFKMKAGSRGRIPE